MIYHCAKGVMKIENTACSKCKLLLQFPTGQSPNQLAQNLIINLTVQSTSMPIIVTEIYNVIS